MAQKTTGSQAQALGKSLEGRRTLVTGAGGFIGSHLVEQLVGAGAEVTAFVHYNARGDLGCLGNLGPETIRQIRTVPGDITDADSVDAAVADQELVLHLAALVGIPWSYSAPRSYLKTNTEGTLNVLEAVRRHSVERLVHTSTSEVYGSARFIPITEQHPLQSQSPYAASKTAADQLVDAWHRSFGTPAVTIRPFNTYGPRQSPRAVIPATIQQALWSDEIRLGALHPVRDMTYVTDTVHGMMLGAVTPGLEGGTFNLGTGTGHTIGDIVRRILELTGRDNAVTEDRERLRPSASEVERLVSDNSAFARASGWAPVVDIDEGLRRCIDWQREQPRPDSPETYAR